MKIEIEAPTETINLIEQIMFDNMIKTKRPPGRLAKDGINRLRIEFATLAEFDAFCAMRKTMLEDGLIKISDEP